MATNFQNIKKLYENDSKTFLETSEILLKFVNNIIKSPENPKYRKIRVGNAIVIEKLLPVTGAVECLFDIGFEEDGEYFTLPVSAPMEKLKKFRDQLVQHRSQAEKQTAASITNRYLSTPNQQTRLPQVINYNLQQQVMFLKKITSSYDHVLIYEDPNLQAKARNCIPIKQLTDQAITKQSDISDQGETVQLQDLILLELLAWFKNSFFHWIDAPKCERCGNATRNVGMANPTPAESMWGAGRVENYQCTQCSAYTRFPRYNHPGKLLDTRGGRCGEWANCFTLCCRAMGFEARYVLDWTDHVWTEVFSETENRWLHCDPCENTCDKPLVYESGWGKKLSYIFAFSKDDIQDVTWRYSSKHQEVLSRRTEASERFVLNSVLRLREQRQKNLTAARRRQLIDRLVVEIVEFMSPKVAGSEELTGRQSGSMAWRLARGETNTNKTSYVFKPTENEVKQRLIHIKYCCASDKYIRVSDNGSITHSWQKCAFEVKDIHRKVEHDWNKVYLARNEGTSTATISWKFEFQNHVTDKIEVQAMSTCFENGLVSWRVCAGEQCAVLKKDGEKTVLDSMSGCKEITLTADLRNGKGDSAFQHTQLFRQNTTEVESYPLEIKIYLKD